MSSRIVQSALPILLFFVVLSVYIHNLSRSVYGGDVGDLVTASYVGGVAHPPGYPLFTFLGFLLTRFDSGTPAFSVGLVSAFSSAFGVLFFYLLSLKLTKSKLISVISSSILAFSYLYWFYAEIAEVFALNSFFVIFLFYLANRLREKATKKNIFLFSFFVGLSLTNHHTIILIFPSLFVLIFPVFKKILITPKLFVISFIFFALGFSFYLYIPIAASHNPVINWDKVHDFSSFLHLLLRKDYGSFSAGIFPSPTFLQRIIILKTYATYLIFQLTIPVILLIILGGIYLFKEHKRLFISFFTGFLFSGPLFIGIYERFFIVSSIFLLFFLPFGLLVITKKVKKLFSRDYSLLFLFVFMLIPIFLFIYNFSKTNLSNIFIGDNLGIDFLSPLPKNAVFLVSGDTELFNTWYVRYGLGIRKDVEVVNINGLVGNEYLEKEQKAIERLFPKEKKEKIFLEALKSIAHKRPLYSYNTINPLEKEKVFWVPYGLTYQFIETKDQIPKEQEFIKTSEEIWSKLHTPLPDDKKNLAYGSLSISDIPNKYSNALLAVGTFIDSHYDDKKLQLDYYNKAIKVNPLNSKPYGLLGLYAMSQKECDKAISYISKAKELDPFDQLSYFTLYYAYRDCSHNENKAMSVIAEFKKTFNQDFFTELKKTIQK